MDLFEDWDLIMAGLKQTFGNIDLKEIRARDFLNIYIPNISKDTNIMNLVRIRQTPSSQLGKEEKLIKLNHRLSQTNIDGSSGFMEALRPAKKAGEK